MIGEKFYSSAVVMGHLYKGCVVRHKYKVSQNLSAHQLKPSNCSSAEYFIVDLILLVVLP